MSRHPAAELRERIEEEAKIPSTKDITEGIEKTKDAIHEELEKRSPLAPEQRVGKDTEAFLDSTKHFIEEKNKGDVIQRLAYDANKSVEELRVLLEKHPFFIDKYQALVAKNQAVDLLEVAKSNMKYMRDLLLTLVNSADFRGLIVDFVNAVQEMVKKETEAAPSLSISTEPTQPISAEIAQKTSEVLSYGQKVATDIQQGTLHVPEDKKESIKRQFTNLIHSLSRDPNYSNAVHGMFQVLDQAQFIAHRVKEQAAGRMDEIATPSLNAMWSDCKLFLINFAGEEPVNVLIKDFDQFYVTMSSDENLYKFMADFRDFIVEVLKNPDLIDTQDFNSKLDDLYNRGSMWMNDPKYNSVINKLWFDIRVFVDSIRTDTTTQKFATDASKLARDIFLDEKGQPSLDIMSTGLNNLRSLVAPILKKNLERVTVPGTSGEDETYKWRIDSLTLNMSDLIPDNIEMRVWGAAKVSLATTQAQSVTYITMNIRNVGVEAKDLKFWFQRKTFPKIEDQGVADVYIFGKNELRVTWKIEGHEAEPWIFTIQDVQCYLANLDITVKESHHSFLMKLLTSLFSGSIRRSVEHKIEENVRESMHEINHQLNAVLRS